MPKDDIIDKNNTYKCILILQKQLRHTDFLLSTFFFESVFFNELVITPSILFQPDY